jgi:hypothetical protein
MKGQTWRWWACTWGSAASEIGSNGLRRRPALRGAAVLRLRQPPAPCPLQWAHRDGRELLGEGAQALCKHRAVLAAAVQHQHPQASRHWTAGVAVGVTAAPAPAAGPPPTAAAAAAAACMRPAGARWYVPAAAATAGVRGRAAAVRAPSLRSCGGTAAVARAASPLAPPAGRSVRLAARWHGLWGEYHSTWHDQKISAWGLQQQLLQPPG